LTRINVGSRNPPLWVQCSITLSFEVDDAAALFQADGKPFSRGFARGPTVFRHTAMLSNTFKECRPSGAVDRKTGSWFSCPFDNHNLS
jgi:hypothetical protein